VEAIELLRERGYTANEIDFESGFWIDYPSAEELGKLARKRRIALSVRNETKHLPYGEGTLRVAPLGKALARFPRPATVISEAPGEESHQAIRAELFAAAGKSSARRSSSRSASSSRSRSRRKRA
jgi:hypothetical protein